jgi:hypothetical protein
MVLMVLGVLLLSVRSFTYFTTERVVGPLGFFAWDVERPHTMFVSPVAAIVAIVVGVMLVMMSRSSTRV